MKSLFQLALAAAISIISAASCANRPEIVGMSCELSAEPLCVDTQSPRLNWSYDIPEGFVQYAYEIHVATRESLLDNPDVWNSGLVVSGDASAVVDNCPMIESFSRYCWRVTAYGYTPDKAEYGKDTAETKDDSNAAGSGREMRTVVSPVAHFETAALEMSDWSAAWISDGKDMDTEAAPMFRKSFEAERDVVSARMYMSAAAYAEVKVNGQKVTDAFLEPGYTHYDKRNLYCTYDISELLRKGENVVSAVLGNGFYNEIAPVATWKFEEARWRGRARFFCEIHILYSDGCEQSLCTDDSWKTCCDGPYISNNIYSGDFYDARREIPGWDRPGFDDSGWENAVFAEAPSPVLTAQKMPPIAPEAILKPVSFKSFGDSIYVYDFGKNISGVSRLTAKGEAGTRVTLEHGELLKADGRLEMGNINIYFEPLGDHSIQRDIYYMKGGARESWNPVFCYHGFRYVEVRSDKPLKLDKNSLEAIYFHTLVPSVGSFESSNPLFNTVWEMVRRTYCNNFHSIITDCPTREKNGWTADSHLAVEMGLFNYDAMSFYEKWVDDVIDNIRPDGRISGIIPDSHWGYDDWIGPVWDAAIFIIPNTMYNFSGDLSQARKLWPVWQRYLEYLQTREESDGLPTYGIGDWVYYKLATPTQFTTPVFYYFDWCTMARFAELLGYDPAPYREKAAAVRDAINAKWYDSEEKLYANGSMAAQGVALYFGIVPEGDEQAVADNLARLVDENNGFLEFGSMGSKTVLRALTEYGHVQQAYTMATKEECPSWGWWVKQGFTTCAETWALDPGFRDASLDHVFLGDVAAWYVNCLAGINYNPSAPGFRNVIIAPHFPEGLDSVKAGYRSRAGQISSQWQRSGNSVSLEFTVPANTSATLVLDSGHKNFPCGTHKVEITVDDNGKALLK